MNDQQFWLRLWTMIAIAVCFLIGCVTFYNHSANRMITTMVADGASPVEASFALSSMTPIDYLGHNLMQLAKKEE